MDESFAARSRADVRSGQPVEAHEVDICDPCEGCAPVFRRAATAESMPRRRRRRLRTVSRWRCRGGAQPRCVLNGIVRDGADPDLRFNDREAFALGGNSYGPMSSRRTTSGPRGDGSTSELVTQHQERRLLRPGPELAGFTGRIRFPQPHLRESGSTPQFGSEIRPRSASISRTALLSSNSDL